MALRIADWFLFLAAIVVGVFFAFDEEPVFDPTDWNVAHAVLLTVCLLVVVWDNIVRARYGQYVHKDLVLVFSTFGFWFSLENYARLIVMVFCFHCLTPLELELVELAEVYQGLLVWYSSSMLAPTSLLALLLAVAQLLVTTSVAGRRRALLAGIALVTAVLAVELLILLWDFLLSSVAGTCAARPAAALVLYAGSRSSLSYDMLLGLDDAYDWHKAQAGTFVIRFEDLYLYFLQLFNVVALYCCAVVWLFLLHAAAGAADAAVDVLPGSTFLGVGVRWLDHALWAFVYSSAALAFVGFRV